jgi:hypothetical protein
MIDKSMLIRKGYKYQLRTKSSHELKLQQASGCSGAVCNKALALRKDRLNNNQACLSYIEMAGHAVIACGEIGAVRPLGEAGTRKDAA